MLSMRKRVLFAKRHVLKFLGQLLPVVGLHLRILHTLLCPVLIPPADMKLRLLEEDKLISDAFFDEHSTGVLGNNRLFILYYKIKTTVYRRVVIHIP